MPRNLVNEKFEKATDVLSDYERKCYSKKTVAKRMAAQVKEKLHVREGIQVTFTSSHTNTDPLLSVKLAPMTVDFLIHKSLVDDSPTIVNGE